jgi:hypothetical protein
MLTSIVIMFDLEPIVVLSFAFDELMASIGSGFHNCHDLGLGSLGGGGGGKGIAVVESIISHEFS